MPSGAKYSSRATSSAHRTIKKLPLGYRMTTSPRGTLAFFSWRLGSFNSHLLLNPIKLERHDSSTKATIDMPSLCHIDKARRMPERANPTRRTMVSGPRVFVLIGFSLIRLIWTTRTENSGRLLASLVGSCKHCTVFGCRGFHGVCSTGGEALCRNWLLPDFLVEVYSPDNVANMVDGVSVVARDNTRHMASKRFKLIRPRRSHESLRGWEQARQEDPSGERRDLGIG